MTLIHRLHAPFVVRIGGAVAHLELVYGGVWVLPRNDGFGFAHRVYGQVVRLQARTRVVDLYVVYIQLALLLVVQVQVGDDDDVCVVGTVASKAGAEALPRRRRSLESPNRVYVHTLSVVQRVYDTHYHLSRVHSCAAHLEIDVQIAYRVGERRQHYIAVGVLHPAHLVDTLHIESVVSIYRNHLWPLDFLLRTAASPAGVEDVGGRGECAEVLAPRQLVNRGAGGENGHAGHAAGVAGRADGAHRDGVWRAGLGTVYCEWVVVHDGVVQPVKAVGPFGLVAHGCPRYRHRARRCVGDVQVLGHAAGHAAQAEVIDGGRRVHSFAVHRRPAQVTPHDYHVYDAGIQRHHGAVALPFRASGEVQNAGCEVLP